MTKQAATTAENIMTIRFLHTADWQIGKGFGQIPGDAGALLREQRLDTVRRIAEKAAEESVDAVLVAGDVFDTQTVSDKTIRRLCHALAAFDGPWVLLPGNHDAALAESVWTRVRDLGCLPDNAILATDPEPILLADDRLAVLPAPLQRRHEAEDLTAGFDAIETPEGAVCVGLAHGSVTNRLPESATQQNPIADDRAQRASLDYLALGDWHGTLEIAPRTWYSGTPETDAFRSQNPGNCLKITLHGPGTEPVVETIPTTAYHWHELDEIVGSEAAVESLVGRLEALGQPADAQVVRLKLSGTLSLAARERLDGILEEWAARFRFLEADTTGLTAEASEADLAALEAEGFVGEGVRRLLALADDPGNSDQPHAMDALQRLYVEYRRAQEAAE